MRLLDLELDCARRLGFANTATGITDTASQTRIRAFLNETQQEIVSEPGMDSLLNDSVTFASVASTPTYALPPIIARVMKIYDTSNRIVLVPASLDWYREAYPSPTAVTGIPDRWIDQGFQAVASQPTSAAELFVKSDSASDDSTKKAFVEGFVTGGYPRTASVALNGVTAVSLSSSITTWIGVTKFYIALAAGGATTAAGNVTLTMTSGVGTELARITPGLDYARYRSIALAICPSGVVTYTVDFQRDITDMAQATDEPFLPPRFHRLLAIGARMREYEKQDDRVRYKDAQSEYLYGMRKLKHYLYVQQAGTPTLRGPLIPQRPSRLGAWFPQDRW